MMAEKKEGALAMVEVDDYDIVSAGTDIREVIADNLGTQAISTFDLDRVKIPAGGGTMWSVPGIDGDEDLKELEGVIVFWQDKRAYWKEGLEDSGGGSPPDCLSEDNITGKGDPGGKCDDCPYAEFGSADEGTGRGQACKQVRILYLVRPGDLLPLVVALPPTSLRASGKYFLRLASKRVSFYAIETKISLEKAKNIGGITYSRVVFGAGRRLSEDALVKIKQYIADLKPVLEARQLSDKDVEPKAMAKGDDGAAF